MSNPAHDADDLLDRITRHQIIDPEPLWQYLTRRGGAASLSTDPAIVASDLVDSGLLTPYQSEHLLRGNEAGLRIGKYQLIQPLGPANSSVYLARRKGCEQRVAVKIQPLGPGTTPVMVERFRREAEALARLDHPGIVTIKDTGEDQGRLFLVMDLVEGQTLADLVETRGPLSPALAAQYTHGALLALHHLHRSGLVHRNLEPHHVMVTSSGQVILIDLGLARFLDEPGASITSVGGNARALGSVEFQAPEQIADSHAVDIRADIYSLGAILYYLLSARVPFSHTALLRRAAGVVTRPQPLGQLREDLPAALIDIVERLMADNPTQRPATPAEAATYLDTWLVQASPASTAMSSNWVPPDERHASRGLFLLVIVALAGLALLVWWANR